MFQALHVCDLFWYVEYCSSVFTRVLSRLQCVQIYSDSATNFVLIQVCVCGCTCVCDTGGSFVVQQVCVWLCSVCKCIFLQLQTYWFDCVCATLAGSLRYSDLKINKLCDLAVCVHFLSYKLVIDLIVCVHVCVRHLQLQDLYSTANVCVLVTLQCVCVCGCYWKCNIWSWLYGRVCMCMLACVYIHVCAYIVCKCNMCLCLYFEFFFFCQYQVTLHNNCWPCKLTRLLSAFCQCIKGRWADFVRHATKEDELV